MSKHGKGIQKGLTTTTTETRTEQLTAEEERVVRMLHGMSEPGDAPLTFETSVDPEVNARLKRMEAMLLAEMHGEGPYVEAEEPASPVSPKDKILARLQQLEDE
ncbi:MAG: hypothetical protein KC561_19465 [Myxococcales bacterium]|nr:hypothetical protein [Myxococcales bacterium]